MEGRGATWSVGCIARPLGSSSWVDQQSLSWTVWLPARRITTGEEPLLQPEAAPWCFYGGAFGVLWGGELEAIGAKPWAVTTWAVSLGNKFSEVQGSEKKFGYMSAPRSLPLFQC